MADNRYDSDYWAMVEFQFQQLRESFFGPPPKAPGGREFRPVAGGELSQNLYDIRSTPLGDAPGLRLDLDDEVYTNRAISKLMSDSLLRRSQPYGDPESFQRQDPLR